MQHLWTWWRHWGSIRDEKLETFWSNFKQAFVTSVSSSTKKRADKGFACSIPFIQRSRHLEHEILALVKMHSCTDIKTDFSFVNDAQENRLFLDQ